ncbi:MAG: efflux RND transporter periplasmic adaptor subunit [candidate division Zixibacteria bacterium]|nr:efflux RND transporter periplasmic adaptor subunit [candidate division Zixibacteria bacterium]
MTKKSKILLPATILIIGFASMMLFLNLRSDSPKRNPKKQSKIVETEIVKPGKIPSQIITYGRVVSTQPVQLYSEVAGILMEGNVPFQPAQSFRKGDLLLKIDDRQAKLALNSTKSDLLNALATVLPEIKIDFPDEFKIWQDYFNNCRFETNLSELPNTDNPKIKLYLSRFNVYKLYFSVRDKEISLSKHYFYAPFDGSITSANLRVGSSARSGTLLGEIINLEKLEVEVSVSAQDIQWINKNSPMKLTSSEIEGEWNGRISRIGNAIDTRTQTVRVFISIDKSEEIPVLEGVFFKAVIPGLRIDNAVRVPQRALYNEKNVYLISNGELEFREVRVARKENGSVLINGGLNDGDTLVTEAMQGVFPGMPAQSKILLDEARSGE